MFGRSLSNSCANTIWFCGELFIFHSTCLAVSATIYFYSKMSDKNSCEPNIFGFNLGEIHQVWVNFKFIGHFLLGVHVKFFCTIYS